MATGDGGIGRPWQRVGDDAGELDPSSHDRRRLRTARRCAIGGAVLGALATAGLGLAGGTGGLGLVVLLLGIMIGCVVAAAHLAVFALLDELRRRPVATRRPIEALGFFLTALFLMLLVMGAASAATDPVDEAEAEAHLVSGGAP